MREAELILRGISYGIFICGVSFSSYTSIAELRYAITAFCVGILMLLLADGARITRG